MTNATPDVVFIHGLWIHSTAWQPWMDLFAEKGYSSIAPGWFGDKATVAETRDDPSGLDGVGIVTRSAVSSRRSFLRTTSFAALSRSTLRRSRA
jgi:cephalosporin-C deacetylase-like acetyl esterase